ncbi:LOW QUALITY PROTEIN: hypothetical protein V1477_006308, partial [Vespula maculifrons]
TLENRTGVIGKGSSRPLRLYFFRPDRTNRSRFITGTKEKKFFLTIFFSETAAPTRSGLRSLERTRSALYAHISFVQIGPIVAEIFLSGTIAPRRTELRSLERALHALYAHIFFVQIGPIGADTLENRTGVIGKGSSRPLRLYFFRPDRTNRSRFITGTKEKKFSLTIFFSETAAPTRRGLGSLERTRSALYAHISFVQIGPIHLREPDPGHWKGLVATSTPVFLPPDRTNSSRVITNFFLRNYSTYENRTGVVRKGSSHPLRTYFFCPDQTNRSRFITEKKFFLTIFFSETAAPWRTGPWSLERTRRALYAHIFFVQIGPIGAEL